MKEFETKNIDPVWENICVTRHAIDQYLDRVVEDNTYTSVNSIRKKLKYVLLEGRRSDRDPLLLVELEPWLRLVKWEHSGRPVSVWMDSRKLCCLVVRDKIRHDQLVILTCFKAQVKSNATPRFSSLVSI